jgi:hypothetical protein
LVRAAVAGGDETSAREAADEIAAIAAACPTRAASRGCAACRGQVAAAAVEAAMETPR